MRSLVCQYFLDGTKHNLQLKAICCQTVCHGLNHGMHTLRSLLLSHSDGKWRAQTCRCPRPTPWYECPNSGLAILCFRGCPPPIHICQVYAQSRRLCTSHASVEPLYQIYILKNQINCQTIPVFYNPPKNVDIASLQEAPRITCSASKSNWPHTI